MEPNSMLETVLYAEDLIAAERFYVDVIGLSVHSRADGRHVFFRCGRGMFLVFNPATTVAQTELPAHGSRGAGHAAFAIEETTIGQWRERLDQHHVAIELDYTWPNGGRSLYVRDPAGNSVELATPRLWGL